jgi:hypothetical protein
VVNVADDVEFQAARERLRELQDRRTPLHKKLDTALAGNNSHDRTRVAAQALLSGEPATYTRDGVAAVRFEIATNEAAIALLDDQCRILRNDAVTKIVEGRRGEYAELLGRMAAAVGELVEVLLQEKQFAAALPHDALPLLPQITTIPALSRELQNFQETLNKWSA